MKNSFIFFLILLNIICSEAIFTHLTKGDEFCVYKTLNDASNFTGSYVISGYNENDIYLTVIISRFYQIFIIYLVIQSKR